MSKHISESDLDGGTFLQENVYCLIGRNQRYIVDFFLYDVNNYYTIRIISDILVIDGDIYINYINTQNGSNPILLNNYDIKFKAHSIYNNESYDIKRWSGFGKINKKLNFTNITLEADANIGLDLYSIQGRPSSDNNDNRYIDRISSGFSVAASQQYVFINNSTSFFIEPKIQFSSV